ELLPPPALEEQWAFIRRHCRLAVEYGGSEAPVMHSMRARLMAYSRGMPEAKNLRARLQHVSALSELDVIADAHIVENIAERGSRSSAAAVRAFNTKWTSSMDRPIATSWWSRKTFAWWWTRKARSSSAVPCLISATTSKKAASKSPIRMRLPTAPAAKVSRRRS